MKKIYQNLIKINQKNTNGNQQIKKTRKTRVNLKTQNHQV